MIIRFLAPELSAQLSVAATGSPRVILSFTPTAPVLVFLAIVIKQYQINREPYPSRQFQLQMLHFLMSHANLTNFEQCRMLLTAPNLQCPDGLILHKLMLIFNAQDTETKAQIAFATFVNQVLTSDDKNNWLYLIKNLIIFDRLVEQQLFVQEIFELALPSVDNFKQNESKYQLYDSQRIVKIFWKIIKDMSSVLVSKQHILCFKRSQRMEFLSTLTPLDVMKQIYSIQCFFRLVLEFADVLSGHKLSHENHSQASKILKCHKQLEEKSTLISYLYLQIFHKLMLYYSCQLLCHNRFLALLSDPQLEEDNLRLFQRHILKFKANSNKFVLFIENHKHIKGLEDMTEKQLNPSQNDDIVKLIDEFIKQKAVEINHDQLQVDHIYSKDTMTVEKSPLSQVNNACLVSRVNSNTIDGKRVSGRQSHRETSEDKICTKMKDKNSNCFFNWDNAYSDKFPQSEIMTVDLILFLKAEEKQLQANKEAPTEQLFQESCNCKLVQIKSSPVCMINKMKLPKNVTFQNVFSRLPTKWNLY